MFALSDLSNFTGSGNIYRYMGGAVFTDGIKFLMTNGAHWLASDAMIACKMVPKLRGQEFISIKAKVKEGKVTVKYDDGNGKVLFTQKYDGTDLPGDLNLYFENNTLMLTSER